MHYSTTELQNRLQRYFTREARDRGESYFYDSLVMSVEFGAAVVTGEVQGSVIYKVALAWNNEHSGAIFVNCTCPHFRGANYCKHLWAFILEIDDTKELSMSFPKGTLALNFGNDLIPNKTSAAAPLAQGLVRGGLPKASSWRSVIKQTPVKRKSSHWQIQTEVFVVMESNPSEKDSVNFKFFTAEKGANNIIGFPRPLALHQNGDIRHPDSQFQASLTAIATLALGESASRGYHRYYSDPSVRSLQVSSLRFLLPALFESSRVFAAKEDFAKSQQSGQSLALKPVRLGPMKMLVSDVEQGHALSAFIEVQAFSEQSLTEGPRLIPIEALKPFVEPNFFRFENWVGFFDISDEERPWFTELSGGALLIPPEDQEPFLETILNQNMKVALPPSLNWERSVATPMLRLNLSSDKESGFDRYIVDLKCHYGSRVVSYWTLINELPSAEDKRIHQRDRKEEDRIFASLPTSLLSQRREGETPTLHAKNFLEFVKAALTLGLEVNVESKKISEAIDFQIEVSSGVDWFDVDGEANFSGRWVKYPSILEALRKGEKFIPLSDGSVGLISDQMSKRLEKLASFAEKNGDQLRFSGAQGLLLNSLLENEQNLKLDEKFKALREKIKKFSGIMPGTPVSSFKGKLRKYQREGLGWLEFLESFGLGGILADDMGLGKTIQCLAFMENRRLRAKKTGPSLLIAPKSLLENWRMEAAKFTPGIRVLIHAGSDREDSANVFNGHDLIVTTYQTMLRDIELLQKIEWDCVIADEAQAIKNPEALISKAAKLLPAKFRLAMTGTPIENSIQDLFSISDFVNPGFLNGKRRSAHLKIADEVREALSQAFKPVVLRRTKEQVLKDLPAKTEQLITVDLEPKQLKVYNELKRFYQGQLLKEVKDKGVKKSQIQILAALTRLRQAALHPGLIDPINAKIKSSKFEVMLEMLEEIVSEDHRVLIFSQFTSLLGLLKKELKTRDIDFCYLDGKSTKRQEIVNDFKKSACPVFLMSLKAGGVGLNLVEADYVFLLDPWWNPAVEAQAIDRVHRIGQKRAVNAYRFIAKNTVEEKILELQKTKRGISDEILGQKSSPLRSLTAQDIEHLFA